MSDAKQAKTEEVSAKAMRPWYLKKRFWIIGALVLVLVGSMLSVEDSSSNTASSQDTKPSETTAVLGSNDDGSADESSATKPKETNETVSQVNARKSAESYLKFQSFSRSGLIKQLEFEKFSTADATYAVDSLTVDWNEQAAKSAKSYLESQSFSRDGLIDQLLFEGFTQEQAEYGVNETGL